ncbi:MAG: acyl carrier protein phosphodiesterase [Flavisolibacter sp.]
MNFLAHAHLSFNDPKLIVGNMISDFVKGASKYSYTKEIQRGILLHREIDQFTDRHPATYKAKEIFRGDYRLYSGPITDIIYDHYLATDPSIFSDNSLKEFTRLIYQYLEIDLAILPSAFVPIFQYMKTEDWLFHYKEKKGIQNSLKGLVRRAKYVYESDTAYRLFEDHYIFLGECYREFYPDVKEFAKEKIKIIFN